MNFLYYLTVTLFISVCVIMILLVLIQKGRGGGLASAFGGSGGNTAFGAKTGDVLTWATSVVFGVFILLAVLLNLLATYHNNQITREEAEMVKLHQESSTQQSSVFPNADQMPFEMPITPPSTQPTTKP